MIENKLKAVIWDLDDTLWDGSLAENDSLVIREELVKIIIELDSRGIINSVCSKNSHEKAKDILEQIGIWEYIVFPVIDFSAKGLNVKSIIENLQLRVDNVLFVDDNIGNLNEVKFYCPGIMLADANDSLFIKELNEVIINTEGQSRLKQYKILEKKSIERSKHNDNYEFLKDSEITICILRNPDDLIFKERIYELANRTNQLNFTKSRFNSISDFEDYIGNDNSIYLHHGCVFVYDKYGDYGLVGFFSFDERKNKRNLDHFFFSCRILNMGVESIVYEYLKKNYHVKKYKSLERISNTSTSYCRIINNFDSRLKAYINNDKFGLTQYFTTIIAGCTSGIIDHYLNDTLKPTRFDTFHLSQEIKVILGVKHVIYTIYTDYLNMHWKNEKGFSYIKFEKHLNLFFESNKNLNMYIIVASNKKTYTYARFNKLIVVRYYRLIRDYFSGNYMSRNLKCNEIVLNTASKYKNIKVLKPEEYINDEDEQIDPHHFKRQVINRMCNDIFI